MSARRSRPYPISSFYHVKCLMKMQKKIHILTNECDNLNLKFRFQYHLIVIKYPPEFAVDAGVGFAAGAVAGHIINLN